MAQIRYFLGGNTPSGFYSLYSELSDPCKVQRLYILKGGAGCGKSTLMKRVAHHGEEAGLAAEYILCSGDPDSLDGVIFPALGIAVVDGTSPHVVEANYAGAVERYVDLSRFYDMDALRPLKEDIIACSKQYRDHYKSAYRSLDAAGRLERDHRESVCGDALRQSVEKRAAGIIRREIKQAKNGRSTLSKRFITAVTHRGPVALWDTVTAQADRIYRLTDSHGLAHHLLSPILTAALAAGQDAVLCPDPMDPESAAHLILPGLSLAFVTDSPLFPWEEKTYRHLRLDAMADGGMSPALRPRIRFGRKVSAALLEEGMAGLARAKEAHDRLEALYNPHVDFDGVCRQADELAEEILA